MPFRSIALLQFVQVADGWPVAHSHIHIARSHPSEDTRNPRISPKPVLSVLQCCSPSSFQFNSQAHLGVDGRHKHTGDKQRTQILQDSDSRFLTFLLSFEALYFSISTRYLYVTFIRQIHKLLNKFKTNLTFLVCCYM